MALNLRNPNGYDGQPGTQYKQGIVRFATDAESTAGTANNVAVTPSQITSSFNAALSNGTATLVAGTVTVANTSIASTDRIIIDRNALNASPALGYLIYTISAGASFTVASYSATGVAVTTDVSGFSYVIVKDL